eukprot:scaffold1335_cov21-Tisochrysis_lutea.AAC.1
MQTKWEASVSNFSNKANVILRGSTYKMCDDGSGTALLFAYLFLSCIMAAFPIDSISISGPKPPQCSLSALLTSHAFACCDFSQASAPPNVATTDYNGLRPHWLTYLTNWTFLLFGAQAALGLAIVIVVSKAVDDAVLDEAFSQGAGGRRSSP